MDPYSRTPKKNTSHGNEVLPQDTTHLIQRPCYQRGSPCSAKIQQAIGQHEDALTTVERRKMQWYGHDSRSSGLAKIILQGTVKGERRQGRQRKRWKDNIREWTGLEFAKLLMLSSRLFFCLLCRLLPFPVSSKMNWRHATPLQFASLYDGYEVFVWPDCLLDLGTDVLVGNMVFV